MEKSDIKNEKQLLNLDNQDNFDLVLIKQIKINKWKNYFKLTSHRIALLAIVLALNICLSFISVYLFQGFAFLGFLRYEITFISYLICLKAINLFYSSLIVIIASWMRFIGIDPMAEWVGVLTMNLSDLFAICIFALFFYFSNIFFKNKNYEVLKTFIIALIVSILVSFWNIILNFSFILYLYDKFYGNSSGVFLEFKTWWYAGVLFGFNISKYMFNFIIFLSLIKPLNRIKSNSNL
ncbi:hypothetical protein [Spiroplasma taiwanense]|uniref:ECF transporter S component n=1 Tax=Spiroplasma taiwanense CT-1 TaxID=1276220 RepID=S5LZ26_9MOLU|nr:hypothetical protein [Spiroplasma taiwanense]AGR40952.1 hypothetical protein STAIW_v1c02890 [Spiroplasma taiwanense CT-1]